jgi:hypothetical protein
MKTEVYSWRVSAQKKLELEVQARREGKSVAQLLDEISSEWLEERKNSRNGDEAEQAALRRRVMKTVGTIRSGDPMLATKARDIVRARIVRKHAQDADASRRID